MEFLALLALFFVLNMLSRAAQRNKGKGQVPRQTRPAARVPARTGEVVGRKQPASIKDMIDEFRRAMEEAERRSRSEEAGVLQPFPSVDSEEDLDLIEERETLEIVPVARSIEVPSRLTERAVIDHDDEAEIAIQERLRWAEEHARGRRPGEHAAFDARIRTKPKKVAEGPSDYPDLRQAVIWREVLGPPVSLRDD